MEQVFPVGVVTFSSPTGKKYLAKGGAALAGLREGFIEEVLEPGNFIISLADGAKVKARGSETLKRGSKIQIRFEAEQLNKDDNVLDARKPKTIAGDGVQFSAMIPLGFGGKGSLAKLEVFVERRTEGGREQNVPATYFVFTVQTEVNGEIQWSILMKGKHISLQVFSKLGGFQHEGLRQLVQEVEKSLKKAGFVILAPTLYLNRLFKVPAGFRLNVRG